MKALLRLILSLVATNAFAWQLTEFNPNGETEFYIVDASSGGSLNMKRGDNFTRKKGVVTFDLTTTINDQAGTVSNDVEKVQINCKTGKYREYDKGGDVEVTKFVDSKPGDPEYNEEPLFEGEHNMKQVKTVEHWAPAWSEWVITTSSGEMETSWHIFQLAVCK